MAKHSTSGKDITGHHTRGRARAARAADQPAAERVPVWQKAFLTALAQTGVVRYAAEATRIARSQVYARRRSNPDFAAAFDLALDEAADLLELEARRRAVEGTEKPVYGRDAGPNAGTVEVGRVREYSDRLLEFLLKGWRPDKYRERHDHRVEASIDDQRRAVQQGAEALSKLPYEELLRQYREALGNPSTR